MRLAIGVVGGLLIGGFLGAQLSGDLVMLTAPVGAVIGAIWAQRGRRAAAPDASAWHDDANENQDGGFFGGDDDDGGDDGGDGGD